MDLACEQKWSRVSQFYHWMTWAERHRFAREKRRLFASMHGRCLMVAAGTGGDFQFFPSGHRIVAIDISAGMVQRAQVRAATYAGSLDVVQMDVQALEFEDESFDSVVTSCTFCSVPDPIAGLKEVRRCLRRDGRLLMFEHVRSRLGPVAIMQDIMTPLSRRSGPEMNRDTIGNLVRAGFQILEERNAYLDVVKAIRARKV